MNTERGSGGLWMVKGSEAKLIKCSEKVGGEGAAKVKAEGLGGPVAGKSDVMGGVKDAVREVGATTKLSYSG